MISPFMPYSGQPRHLQIPMVRVRWLKQESGSVLQRGLYILILQLDLPMVHLQMPGTQIVRQSQCLQMQ